MSGQLHEQKVILITGASNGIGEATALEYAKLGCKIAFTGRNLGRLDEVLRSLVAVSNNKTADDFLALQADFEDQAQVESIVTKTVSKFGKLDVLINNAGYPGKSRNINDEDFFDDFKNIMQVNLMAATRLAQLATPHLLKTKGVIINVSSVADRIPLASVSYSVSKAGLTMMGNCLANSLAGTGVRVVTVSPGPIKTKISRDSIIDADSAKTRQEEFSKAVSLKRFGESDEVAQTIVFLTSDKASFINGCTIDVDGGMVSHLACAAMPSLSKANIKS